MKFDRPAQTNPADRLQVIGKPVPRVEGALKVTGQATYAAEWRDEVPGCAHGWIVPSTIALGTIRRIDTRRAEAAPGVLAVVTHENAGPLGQGKRNTAPLLAGPKIAHYHQAVAVVVAETLEQARAAAQLVQVDAVAETPRSDLAKLKSSAKKPKDEDGSQPADTAVGDFDGAFGAAAMQFDATYTTTAESHVMMEPHATIARWDGDRLTVWNSNQMVDWGRTDLAATLKIPKDKVRLVTPYIGGGFGGKLFIRADVLLAALGARAAGRPVKVVLPRPLMANNTTHRPATIQRVRIGTTRDGTIQAIGHECWSADQADGKPDTAVNQTRNLYAAPNRLTRTRLAEHDLPEANAMRAPGEATGHMALEAAMDEAAVKLGLDPIEFRIRNDSQVDPEKPERPISQQPLVRCLKMGAARFGWARRDPKPGRMRDGRWRVGMGVASAYRGNLVVPSAARVRLDQAGRVVVETDMTDIGTGSYTVLAQTAAEMLGVGVDRVDMRLGDSRLPVSSGSGGQFGANSSASGVYAACLKLREAVAQRLGMGADAVFEGGDVVGSGRRVPLLQAVAGGELVGEDRIEFGDLDKKNLIGTFGAHFVEVGVDADTCEIRVRRMLAVCASGRILNPRTARSQVIGSMTQGLGAALMEELAIDHRAGYFVNHDMAGYEVPVHADIPVQEVVFLDEPDPMSSPLKVKGVAELGICGVAAAIANAVWHATGVRVRDYPITLDKLFAAQAAGAR